MIRVSLTAPNGEPLDTFFVALHAGHKSISQAVRETLWRHFLVADNEDDMAVRQEAATRLTDSPKNRR